MAWYYNVNNKQAGPVEEAGIKDLIAAGKITGSTLVWQTGMEGWQPVSATPLAALLPEGPPPLAPASMRAPPSPVAACRRGPPESSSEERMWAALSHLSSLLLGVLGPLVLWLVQKERFPLVDDQAKEAAQFPDQRAGLLCDLRTPGLPLDRRAPDSSRRSVQYCDAYSTPCRRIRVSATAIRSLSAWSSKSLTPAATPALLQSAARKAPAMAWYYNLNNQQTGPVDEARIKELIAAGQIIRGTLVWQSGMDRWQPASATSLAALLPEEPPPLMGPPPLWPRPRRRVRRPSVKQIRLHFLLWWSLLADGLLLCFSSRVICVVLGIPALIAAAVFSCLLLYKLWAAVQDGGRKPRRAKPSASSVSPSSTSTGNS